MNFPSGFFNTIILLGAVQGFIVSTLLFFSKKNKQSNRLLSALIFLIALASFNLYGNYVNWFGSNLVRFITQLLPLVAPMAFGPLLYFYTQSVLDPTFKITKKQGLHFLPVMIDLIPSLTIIVFIVGLITKLVKNHPGPWGNFIDDYNVYADIPRWISITFYVWRSSKYLKAYGIKHGGFLNGQTVHFKWLLQCIRVFMIFQSIWLLYLIPYVIPRYTDWMLNTFDWYPIYIPMSIIIYWLGIKGYMMSNQNTDSIKKATGISSALSFATRQKTIALLKNAMEKEHLYLNPNLNLAAVSQHTNTPQKIISAVLNQHEHKSFNDFVNEYRLNAFKEKILMHEMDHLTIAGVALECGFSSQATFQRVFKDITGISPSAFRKGALEIQ